MNNLVTIKVKTREYYDLIKYLINNNIYYSNLCIIEDYVYIDTMFSSVDIINNKYIVYIVKYSGTKKIIRFIKREYIFILSIIFSLIIIKLLSLTIFSIEINTSNDFIKERILLSLEEEGITKYKFIKSYKRINTVKDKILLNNKDYIEWIEITRNGTKYIVDITEKINKKERNSIGKTDIVAKKDGLIKYIYVNRGVKLKEVNEIVKKGDTLISGTIYKDEDIVDYVKSSGKVYAEVWYKVAVVVPLKHTIYYKTNDSINHIYMDLFGKKITLIGKYETKNYMSEETVLISKPYLPFKIYKETKDLYTYEIVNLSIDEATNEAIKRSDKAILNKLNIDEYIIDKNVLKKNVYSSKIELEVFYRVYESIGESKNIETFEGE